MQDFDDVESLAFEFESSNWDAGRSQSSAVATPELTPGLLGKSHRVDEEGMPIAEELIYGIHWTTSSYPAWTGHQPAKDARRSESLPSTPGAFLQPATHASDFLVDAKKPHQFEAPFGIQHIAAMTDQVRQALGFQFDASVNVFELLMSQLDSRSSRSSPKTALRTLHADYISGTQANFRKWYFAAQVDCLDREADAIEASAHKDTNIEEATDQGDSDAGMMDDDEDSQDMSLNESEAIWTFRHSTSSFTDEQRLVDLLVYLFCWTEANQVRFMPECLAFIVKCARDYYTANFSALPHSTRHAADLPTGFYLDHIVTPLYNCYRAHNYMQTEAGKWIRLEGDHKNFIGYDDMNQLFWSREGISRILDSDREPIVTRPKKEWLMALASVEWSGVFSKTYRESRSWLHLITNFSRLWILHISAFWFYTTFNSPSLYTVGFNYMDPAPPLSFVRWTIMSLGGLFGPFISFCALIGEVRFVPQKCPTAQPVWHRLFVVILLFLILAVPAVCNLTLNPWPSPSEEVDLMPANIIAGVLFSIALLYTVYFSFQPLGSLFGANHLGSPSASENRTARKFLANKLFTASFPRLKSHDAIISWLMCLMVFGAKLTESYFFLTLSVRDPIQELSIMSLEDHCIGDMFLIGSFLCRAYPRIILGGIILTDMALFFLDTYLWYVIFNSLISVSIAFKGGTSVWTPWRNVYSRLPQRITSKLLAPNTSIMPGTASRAFALRVVWNSIVESMCQSCLLSRDQAQRLTYVNAATQEPRFFTVEEDGKALASTSHTSASYRRISFFAQSLSTPMQPAVAVEEMPSFTVLIPHFKEKIILSLSESIRAEIDSKVTILEYLQRLYPHEWENFVQETQRKRQEAEMEAGPMSSDRSRRIAEQRLGFSSLDPNQTNRTRLWCSERAQTLYRTVRGFSNYSHAIKVLYYSEERQDDSSESSPQKVKQDIEDLSSRKFRLVVAMQLYSDFDMVQLSEVEAMMSDVPELVVSYIEHDEETDTWYSCMFNNSCPLLESGKRRPRLRIRLSGNPILGDGKSDNQNCALPFYRGEYIQLVDANQDNYLEECLKIRNVLMEFEDGGVGLSSADATAPIASDVEAHVEIFGTTLSPDTEPVAIVGAREYIFSENIGILGDVAAGKEQTFGTLFARTLAKIGAKLHYGHPDFLNAIFMTTRGGVSKGQRGLHLNEDIYAGMTVVLRGGQIRHSEYFQCGKGRDLGFVSILNFTTKIGAGMGEQILSREYFYLGTQLPFDRFISFYYAHPGFHLNNVFIMLTLEMLLVVILWISSIASVSALCYHNNKTLPTDLHRPAGCANVLPLLDWIRRCVVSIFLVFFISLCPLFFQELIEKGMLKSLIRIGRHFGSLSMLFEVFSCRIYARSFWEDLNIGGAKYVATGRGFATQRVPFYRLYTGYFPETVTGLKALAILVFASSTLWDLSYLWFWLTTFSFLMCPVLYNPHQFAFHDFSVDYGWLLKWFWRATTPARNEDSRKAHSWVTFIKHEREKLTGVKRRTLASESTRPAFRNAMVSKVGTALINVICLGVPYIYMGNQKVSRHQSEPSASPVLRILIASFFQVAANIAVLVIGFPISIILFECKVRRHGNIIALINHALSILLLIFSGWVIYILEGQNAAATVVGIMAMCSMHHLLHTILTVLLVRRQRSLAKTNDPWWNGCWRLVGLGWKTPVVMGEELIVKTVESTQFAYDFLTCHFILALHIPFLLIPYVDKLHSLFLLWLRPSVTSAAARTVSLQRRRQIKIVSRCFFVLFVLMTTILTVAITLPAYLPPRAIGGMQDMLNQFIRW